MSGYENVGAYLSDGQRPRTKKALREALKADPAGVVFDPTSLLTGRTENLHGDNVPEGLTLVVVGPDPYRTRNWYANVKRGTDGKPKLT